MECCCFGVECGWCSVVCCQCTVWLVRCKVWLVQCCVWLVWYGVWLVRCRVWLVRCRVWLVQCCVCLVQCCAWLVISNCNSYFKSVVLRSERNYVNLIERLDCNISMKNRCNEFHKQRQIMRHTSYKCQHWEEKQIYNVYN